MLNVALPTAELTAFASLLQRGVGMRATDGASVAAFLVDGLGVDPAYVRDRISTVFLDRSVVDDLERARLGEGSSLALSAAMPGLVGATLRKGGYYGAMRAAITRAPDAATAPAATPRAIRITVKLFNLLVREIGPNVLAAGIALSPSDARAVLGARAAALPDDAAEVWLRVTPG